MRGIPAFSSGSNFRTLPAIIAQSAQNYLDHSTGMGSSGFSGRIAHPQHADHAIRVEKMGCRVNSPLQRLKKC